MKLEGEFPFQGTCDKVWNAILDPAVLSTALPGIQKFEKQDDDHYQVTMEMRIGPVTGVFHGTVSLQNKEYLKGYTMIFEGKGGPGFAKGTCRIEFTTRGETTVMQYRAELQVGGRLASVGQRLLDTVGKSMTRQALEAINRSIQARVAGLPAAQISSAMPSQAKFVMGIFKDVLAQALKSRALWIAVLLLTIVVTVIVILICGN